jgi:hypothetical protein
VPKKGCKKLINDERGLWPWRAVQNPSTDVALMVMRAWLAGKKNKTHVTTLGIKRGNGQSPTNGGSNRKIICKCWIVHCYVWPEDIEPDHIFQSYPKWTLGSFSTSQERSLKCSSLFQVAFIKLSIAMENGPFYRWFTCYNRDFP